MPKFLVGQNLKTKDNYFTTLTYCTPYNPSHFISFKRNY